MKQKRYLIIQFMQRGDILLTVPIAHTIKQQDPRAHISFLTFPMGLPLLQTQTCIDEIIILDPQKPWYQTMLLMLRLRKMAFDTVFDFMNNPRSAIACLLTGAPHRIGQESIRSFLYTDCVKKKKSPSYVVKQKLAYLQKRNLLPENPDLQLSFPAPQEAHTLIANWRAKHLGSSDIPIVAMSPTHKRITRRWPGQSYVALAQLITHHFPFAVVWVWGPGEYDYVKDLASKAGQRSWIAPKTNLVELSALLNASTYFIGNSNGPSHIAVANQLVTLEIHGATDANCWVNTASSNHHFVAAPIACQPCNKNTCRFNTLACLTEVTPQHVFDRFKTIAKS